MKGNEGLVTGGQSGGDVGGRRGRQEMGFRTRRCESEMSNVFLVGSGCGEKDVTKLTDASRQLFFSQRAGSLEEPQWRRGPQKRR